MFNRVIVAVIGSSNTGKTMGIEVIIKELIRAGYTVATIKHIPDPKFTIDTIGKDTWRYAESGASTILSIAPKELTVVNKVNTTKYTLDQIIAQVPMETDVIIIEGFKKLIGEDMTIPKIVTVKTIDEITEALKKYNGIVAFIGPISDKNIDTKIPIIDVENEIEKLAKLVLQKIKVPVERKQKHQEKITIQINQKILPLGDFVQNIIRNSVLAMVSSLKGVKIKGEEKVSIVIDRLTRG